MRHLICLLLSLLIAFPAAAQDSPLRPKPRPVPAPATDIATATPLSTPSLMRPQRRPGPELATAPDAVAAPLAFAPQAPVVLVRSIRPPRRPDPGADVVLAGAEAPRKKTGLLGGLFGKKKDPAPKRSVKGSVCGDPAIRGEEIPRIVGKLRGCGIANPVRVTEIDGVRMDVPATLDCDVARATKTWISKVLKPELGRDEPVQVQLGSHYSCRTRNSRKGARISEHGRGLAIDIVSVRRASGAVLDVRRDYRRPAGAALRRAHKAACGIFGTTLGPGSDGYHEDHLHFDVARHRNGPYCR